MNRFIRTALACGLAVAGLAVASDAAQAAVKPQMSFKQANRVTAQQVARAKLEFPVKAASAGALSWSWGCNQYARLISMYWNGNRYYAGHDTSQVEIGPDDSPYGIEEFRYSWRRASTWWRCNTRTFGLPQDQPDLWYIRLRIEVAGTDGNASGSSVACEVRYNYSQQVVGREPAGCALGV